MGKLENKVAVITGGSLGIGKAKVSLFAREGAKVAMEEAKKALAALHPLGHIGEPIDIAYAALYLASDESKFVTGSELVIDGGYTAR